MSRLASSKRARLPASAFAYVDSRGRRRLPIHDESHVRNALARFSQVAFEDEAARERARMRLLNAAKKYSIVPVGFITGQLQSERRNATAGRLVIELGQHAAPVSSNSACAASSAIRPSPSCTGPTRPARISTARGSPFRFRPRETRVA
jgi:hypothetical protein